MKQYLTLIFCFLTLLSFSQDKKVHLVHGLGGDSGSWSNFSSDLQKDCDGLYVTTFENTSNEGMAKYSSDLRSNLDPTKSDQDVAVGHSFGGINLRNIDSEGYFGAYITVASVHEGSPLASSKLDGNLELWMDAMCKEVITEPYNAITGLNTLFGLATTFQNEAEDLICKNTYDALNFFASEFVGNGQSVYDLQVGGAVSDLPPASIPGIGIVCTSEGHPLWTLIEGGYPFIKANLLATTVEVGAISASHFFNVLSNLTFNPIRKRKLRKASKECKDSYNFLQNSDSAWNQLIGSGGTISYSTSTSETWVCDCYDINSGQPIPCTTQNADVELIPYDIDPMSTCSESQDCWVSSTYTEVTFGPDLPSDGLVPLNRQSLPGSIHEDKIRNVSHFEQPKNEAVQNKIFKHLHPSTAIHQKFIIQKCL